MARSEEMVVGVGIQQGAPSPLFSLSSPALLYPFGLPAPGSLESGATAPPAVLTQLRAQPVQTASFL